MKLYRIEADTERLTEVKWAGSLSGAAAVRKEFMAKGAKRADLETKELDVPTSKDALIQWLNERGA